MQSQFERTTLLAIHRQFTENEAVKYLEQQLSAANFEIGLLKSDLAESKDSLKKLATQQATTIAENAMLKAELSEKNQQLNNIVEQIANAIKKQGC